MNFYESREWLELRYRVLKQFGCKCMLCGSEKDIHVDHIKPRSLYPELALEFTNCQVLCGQCNKGKSNKHEDDWRPARVLPKLDPAKLTAFIRKDIT